MFRSCRYVQKRVLANQVAQVRLLYTFAVNWLCTHIFTDPSIVPAPSDPSLPAAGAATHQPSIQSIQHASPGAIGTNAAATSTSLGINESETLGLTGLSGQLQDFDNEVSTNICKSLLEISFPFAYRYTASITSQVGPSAGQKRQHDTSGKSRFVFYLIMSLNVTLQDRFMHQSSGPHLKA